MLLVRVTTPIHPSLNSRFAGCCHTDLHAALGDWPLKAKSQLIGGHEGAGIVVAIGANTAQSPVKLGDRVGIKWLADSCLNCDDCRNGREQSAFSSFHLHMVPDNHHFT
jgi:alcohol dehydrogenase, propanol-preferring